MNTKYSITKAQIAMLEDHIVSNNLVPCRMYLVDDSVRICVARIEAPTNPIGFVYINKFNNCKLHERK